MGTDQDTGALPPDKSGAGGGTGGISTASSTDEPKPVVEPTVEPKPVVEPTVEPKPVVEPTVEPTPAPGTEKPEGGEKPDAGPTPAV